jgi:hypothetical protein
MDSVSQVNLIKNGKFDSTFIQDVKLPKPFVDSYKRPNDWICSQLLDKHQRPRGPIIWGNYKTNKSPLPFAPSPLPNNVTQFLVLQPYDDCNHRVVQQDKRLCFVKQQLSLTHNSQYTLTFYATSRNRNFTHLMNGTLVIMVNSIIIFTETLPHKWTKYTVEFTSPSSEPILSFINIGIYEDDEESLPSAYTTSIADIELKEKQKEESNIVKFTDNQTRKEYIIEKNMIVMNEDAPSEQWYVVKDAITRVVCGRTNLKQMELFADSDEDDEDD